MDILMPSIQDDNDVEMYDELRDFDFTMDENDDSALTETTTAMRYELRPQPYAYILTTPYDNDQSGDWNPDNVANEESFLTASRLASRGRPANATSRQAPSSGPHHESELHARMTGRSFPVVLSVKSDAGRRILSLHPSYWPFDVEANAFSSEFQPEQENSGYSLRKRRAVAYHTQDEESYDNLVGHPEARGCKICYSCGAVCDLTLPGAPYPCSVCGADDHLCEPCIPPKKKDACEGCRDKLVPCSYDEIQTDEHHAGPCHRCQVDNVPCVAGPASGSASASVRIGVDGTPVTTPHRPREYTSCTACRTAKITCSLRRKKDPSLPCVGCQENGTPCTFESVPRQTNKATTGQADGAAKLVFDPEHADLGNRTLLKTHKLRTDILLTPKTYHIVPMPDSKHERKIVFQTGYNVPGVATAHPPQPPTPPVDLPPPCLVIARKQIVTQLCHPVQVNHPDQDRCNWCENPPAYSRYGQGDPRTVKVITRMDRRAYIELEGGYATEPFSLANSIMCEGCTQTRWKWIQHKNHNMTRIGQLVWGCDLCKNDIVTHFCTGGDCNLQLCQRCSEVMVDHAGGRLEWFLQGHSALQGSLRAGWEARKKADLELLHEGGFIEMQMTLGRLEDDEVI